MQYLILVLLVFVGVAIIVALLPYISLIITDINNVNARVYTLFNSSTYMSGTWFVNGSKIQQISQAPTNKLIIEVAQGSYIYISNETWSAMLSNNGDNGPIFSPYATFNLSAGYYKYNIPTQAFDFEQPVYSVLSSLAFFLAAAVVFILFMVLSYSRRR
jgi:hypothetical protein